MYSRQIARCSPGFLLLFIAGSIATVAPALASDWKILVNPNNSFQFSVLNGTKSVLTEGTAGWAPKWAYFGIASSAKSTSEVLKISTVIPIGKQKPTLGLQVEKAGANQVAFEYELQSETDIPIMMIDALLGVPDGVHAKAILSKADGSDVTIALPMNISEFGVVSKIAVTSDAWDGPVNVALDPPMQIASSGSLRVKLAADVLKSGVSRAKVTFTFPSDCSLLIKKSDVEAYAPVLPTADWFPSQTTWSTSKSEIGVEDWLDKPAGKHGGVRMKGDHFEFEDGTPVKFWGTNLTYQANAPEKANADATAARFAKYGVNGIRMHKFLGSGWEGISEDNTAVKTIPKMQDRLDYFTNQLAQQGVYYGFSHTFNFKIGPGDKARISGFDEIMKNGGRTYAVINWAEDVQDLMIEAVVNLLKHTNPYTGKTYAQDPALSYVELQNEDDIFFYSSKGALAQFPTYRKQLEAHFSQWLQTKYGTQEKLAAAWSDALGGGETLDQGTVKIQDIPWNMSDQHLPQTTGGERQRLLDLAAFLHYTQDKFYTKFVKAIRETGYQGPLVGSPWQAPAMLPHYYNLQSDQQVGYIDRHNYFGEGFLDTMMKTPGGGDLSSGLQQVAGRPFGVSEWIHCYPALYSAEGPVIMAAYGMGLQGWSASYEFTSGIHPESPAKATVGHLPFAIWNVDQPTQIGQYPILARMVLRGDVTTGPIISNRRISPDNLEKGEFNFSDSVQQQGDVKTFTGSVPAEALAAGRDVVEFVDQTTPSTFPDMKKFTQGTTITSATGQLKWESGDGVITIDTPGTQGYVGFAQGKQLVLGDVTIQPATPYASILLTAADMKGSLANDRRVLISAVARNSNSGFRILSLDNKTIVDNGTAPIMLEPVKADISFTSRKIKQVNILDQDGNESGRTLPSVDGKFTINGVHDHAIYYEVLFGS